MSITSVRSRPGFTSSAEFAWPEDFARIPDEEWTRRPVDEFGLNYDDVGNHGWYKNLEPTIAQVLAALAPGDLLVDYSSGTGILTRRLLGRLDNSVGIINVDADHPAGGLIGAFPEDVKTLRVVLGFIVRGGGQRQLAEQPQQARGC